MSRVTPDKLHKAEEIASCLQDMGYSINFARNVLFGVCGVTGNSWENLIAAASGTPPSHLPELNDVFQQILIVGAKIFFLYELDSTQSKKIEKFLKSAKSEDSIFLASYPFLTNDQDLATAPRTNQIISKLTYEVKGSTLMTMQFCAKATYRKTHEVGLNELTDDARSRYDEGEVESIKITSKLNTQLFNSVVFNKNKGYLLLGADTSELSSAADQVGALARLKSDFKKLSGVSLPTPKNLFPKIEELYQKKTGRILKVEFITPSDSVNSLAIKQGDRDVRNDSYHKAGELEVDALEKFKIQKAWDYIFSEHTRMISPTITLNGNKKCLHNADPLREFSVKDCPTLAYLTNILEDAFF
ncbi:hypothetical protein BFC18_14750 [Alteromonas confluentis]|uniref:Uncharacterized protein n=2 Tax=Alteromonas confluentis TaxID=1656094 RepID=A0A1E7ZA76_9ALTE|nr:hypothetical protein BFC18_14750 [Alteromonas confluentis]